MSRKVIGTLVAIGALLCLAIPTNSRAAENSALNADILKIALDWEHIKFQETDKDLQEKQMAASGGSCGRSGAAISEPS